MSQLTIQKLSFTYEGSHIPIFKELSLSLDTNWKLGLVGRNGRGKTTLLHLLDGSLVGAGTIACSEGCVYAPRPVIRQEQLTGAILEEQIPQAERWRLARELSRLGLGEDIMARPFSSLSGGEQTRALLAAVFLDESHYPMLDEPTNHLDAQGRALVASYLSRLNRGFLLVSHDRGFLDDCVNHILAINRTGTEVIRGNFSTWFSEKERRNQREQAQNEKLQGEIKRLQTAARRAASWSEQVEQSKYATKNAGLRPDRGYIGHKSAKMMRRSKHIQSRQEGAAHEKAGLLKDVEHIERLQLSFLQHYSTRLIALNDVGISYGTREICKDISFTINSGDQICLMGENGCGKTSLLNLIRGDSLSHTGELWRASGLKISYVSQQSEWMAGALKDWARAQGADWTLFLTILRKLDFSRELFERELQDYSAGEKKKVLLAASMCCSAHLYIWDEPLNYVDIFSRIQIESLLLEYRPTLLFVEHERIFQEKIATQTIYL